MINLKKMDFSGKMKDLQARSEKNQMSRELQPGEVLCPFQSSAENKVPCTPECALYRRSAKKYEFACPFTEIGSLAWNVKDLNDRSRGNGHRN